MKKEIDTILSEMFPEYDITASEEEKDDFWRNLTEQQTYDVNAIFLRENANPDHDYLVCWEPGRFDDEEQVTDFDTMYDVDYNWWEFQKQAQWESIEDLKQWMEKGSSKITPTYVANSINRFNKQYGNGYKIYCSGDWYRLIENDVFLYSQFISAHWYLYYQAENLLDDLQEENIPYSFRGDGSDFLSNINEKDPAKKYDAGGREVELESYNKRIAKYQNDGLIKRIDFLIKKYSRVFSGKTFRKDRGYEPGENFDPFTDFIFYDEQSLMNVETKNFLKTFKACQDDYAVFEKMIEELKQMVTEDFYNIYNKNKQRFK